MSKHPIFVIEGPDGVGKTTLSDKLCEVLGAKYVHLTYRFKDKMHLYHGAALSYALKVAERQPVVIDRWWPSEVVYAKAYRGGTKWPLLHRHVERVALRHGLTYVFCLPEDRARYLDHFNVLKGKREEMYDSGMDRVYDEFVKIYDRLDYEFRPNLVRYDLFKEGHQLDEVVQSIIETSAEDRAVIPDHLKSLWVRGFSGSSTHATHLVVLERPEGEKPRNYPMVGPSGVRMSRILDILKVPESRVAYAYLGSQSANTTIAQCARHMRVVAMGQRVAAQLAGFLSVPPSFIVPPMETWSDNMEHDHLNFQGIF